LPHFDFESHAISLGHDHICGIDEAGRGPLAGPVVAAACSLPSSFFSDISNMPPPLLALNDSKKLSAKKREELFEILLIHRDIETHIEVISAQTIDEINILQATLLGMQKACLGIKGCSYALIDGNQAPDLPIPSKTIIKGDSHSFSVAAASILAKVHRDRLMLELDKVYPEYGFCKHKGYGTRAHIEAIKRHNPCPEHRRSFEPVKSMISFSCYSIV